LINKPKQRVFDITSLSLSHIISPYIMPTPATQTPPSRPEEPNFRRSSFDSISSTSSEKDIEEILHPIEIEDDEITFDGQPLSALFEQARWGLGYERKEEVHFRERGRSRRRD